jgi:hypothetical protein
MLSVIVGAVAIVAAGVSFWWLLPRAGQVHPMVRNTDVGSMVTLAIMSVLTFGAVMLFAGLIG